MDKKEFFKTNKSFCPAAFREIYVDSNGRYRLCCHARPVAKVREWKESKIAPFEYFNSDEMEDIRNKMFSGEPIAECATCYSIEKNSGTSYREKYINTFGYTQDIRDVTIRLRIFGSYCNLACYMCYPSNSSARRKELKEIFGDNITKELGFEFAGDYRSLNQDQYKDHTQNILDNIHIIKEIHMTGGETLQLPKYWEFLESIPEEHAKNIKICHDTNFTKLDYKDKSIFDFHGKFKGMFFGVSCDHFGEKNEWIRYPINQNEFEKNLQKTINFKHYKMELSATVSVLNIDDLNEIESYYKEKFNLTIIFNNIVRGPEMLAINNLPLALKEEYKEKYKRFPYVIAQLNMPATRSPLAFVEYCEKLSIHRKFNFKDMWSDYIKKINNASKI
jgi:MoaA/NifB/PqqE/SkfB family radical SAM enzyme